MVALVGYTNSGKSTLLNALATADAYVDNKLFATLDTKTRLLHLEPGHRALISDTVGFIRHLPHGLVASFRSTLEEAAEADLLLLVADASHAYVREHLQTVESTLAEIGAAEVPRMLLLNKWDLVEAEEDAAEAWAAFPEALPVSALRRNGLNPLKDRISEQLALG